MSRTMLALAFASVAALAATARADGEGVKPTSTVEVLDDKAQIDDVISRMKTPRESDRAEARAEKGTVELKTERPPLATTPPTEKKAAAIPEGKTGARWRGSHRERGAGTPERTERPRHGHR